MRPLLLIAVMIFALAALAGCNKTVVPPPPATPAIATSPRATSDLVVDATDDGPTAEHVEVESDPKAEAEPNSPNVAERIILLTPGAPLIVDVHLTIAGRPYRESFDALIGRVLKAADTDGDGRPTWKNLAANEEFLKSISPNMEPLGSRQMKELIAAYDENRDGQIQPAEAAAWLGRDSGGSLRPFAVRSSRSYLPIPSASSRVWQLLDADKDGQLSAEELRAAPQRFWSFDADDDRAISQGELATLREQLEAAARTTSNREPARSAAIYLEPQFDLDRLEYLLADLYSPHEPFNPGSFPALPQLFRQLDANGDGALDQSELAAMRTLETQLELSLAFDEPSDSGEVSLKILKHAPELKIIAQPRADRVVILFNQTRLLLSAHDFSRPASSDNISATSYGDEARRAQIGLMAHDQCDALFEYLDQNGDGILGEREIADAPSRLMEKDLNRDGSLSGDELPYAMIVAFQRGEAPGEQSFYVPTAAPIKPKSVVPEWFRNADFNGDGDISRREFLGTAEQFDKLDADRDGYISSAEAAAYDASNPAAGAH